jgi:hypothetical protein
MDTDVKSADAADEQVLDEASEPFVGRWNRLVSTTNWEKGRIIFQWREALVAEDAKASEYSDEAWARRVGSVTGQHVGRLRRVYQRFGSNYESYDNLYWSHFHAAFDWDDAEMWLEGAAQSGWSVSQMRRTRWETLGDPKLPKPRDAEIVSSELDEDFEPAITEEPTPRTISGKLEEVKGSPVPAGPDFGDEKKSSTKKSSGSDSASIYTDNDEGTIRFVRPFENLAELPDDLAEAFDAFKLAILRHKADGWQQIARDDVLASLDALRELALAPSVDQAPF